MLRHISIEGTRPRPFMYWANKLDTDCIERLFKYYEHTTKLSRFYNEDFVEKWAKKLNPLLMQKSK